MRKRGGRYGKEKKNRIRKMGGYEAWARYRPEAVLAVEKKNKLERRWTKERNKREK